MFHREQDPERSRNCWQIIESSTEAKISWSQKGRWSCHNSWQESLVLDVFGKEIYVAISVNKKPELIYALVLISRDSWVPAANRDTLDTYQFLEGSCLNFHTINYLIVSSVHICTASRELHICVRNVFLSSKIFWMEFKGNHILENLWNTQEWSN